MSEVDPPSPFPLTFPPTHLAAWARCPRYPLAMSQGWGFPLVAIGVAILFLAEGTASTRTVLAASLILVALGFVALLKQRLS
jgi:hypothetical protein